MRALVICGYVVAALMVLNIASDIVRIVEMRAFLAERETQLDRLTDLVLRLEALRD